MSVGQQELEEVKEKFEISNLFEKDGQIIVRVVTQKRPEGYDEIRGSRSDIGGRLLV